MKKIILCCFGAIVVILFALQISVSKFYEFNVLGYVLEGPYSSVVANNLKIENFVHTHGPYCKAYPVKMYYGFGGKSYYEIKEGLTNAEIEKYFYYVSVWGYTNVTVKKDKNGHHKIPCLVKWFDTDLKVNAESKSGVNMGFFDPKKY